MPHDPLYTSKQWKDTREKYLRLHPDCAICAHLPEHLRRRAVEVDHKLAVNRGGALFDFRNLRGLCKTHHSQKTFTHDSRTKGEPRKPIVVTGPDGYPVYIEK